MDTVLLFLQMVLFVWFFGCIVTYKICGHLLVEGMGIRLAEFIMFVLYGSGIALELVFPAFGKRYLFAILVLWLVIQFFCHWYYTIFGVSEKKLRGYNECFKGSVRLFPVSDSHLVPDLYHIILHLLILINLVLLLLSVLSR